MIVSADTLVYFGPLEDVVGGGGRCAAARRTAHLHRGGMSDAGSEAGYSLSHHGRYSHTRQYLERVLSAAGLRPEIVPAELRLEAGDPVEGLVVRATKPTVQGVSACLE